MLRSLLMHVRHESEQSYRKDVQVSWTGKECQDSDRECKLTWWPEHDKSHESKHAGLSILVLCPWYRDVHKISFTSCTERVKDVEEGVSG
jgi:hypothetical protein